MDYRPIIIATVEDFSVTEKEILEVAAYAFGLTDVFKQVFERIPMWDLSWAIPFLALSLCYTFSFLVIEGVTPQEAILGGTAAFLMTTGGHKLRQNLRGSQPQSSQSQPHSDRHVEA